MPFVSPRNDMVKTQGKGVVQKRDLLLFCIDSNLHLDTMELSLY